MKQAEREAKSTEETEVERARIEEKNLKSRLRLYLPASSIGVEINVTTSPATATEGSEYKRRPCRSRS